MQILGLIEHALSFTQPLFNLLRCLRSTLTLLLGLTGMLVRLLSVASRFVQGCTGLRRQLLDSPKHFLRLGGHFAGGGCLGLGLVCRVLRLTSCRGRLFGMCGCLRSGRSGCLRLCIRLLS